MTERSIWLPKNNLRSSRSELEVNMLAHVDNLGNINWLCTFPHSNIGSAHCQRGYKTDRMGSLLQYRASYLEDESNEVEKDSR